MFRGEAFGHDLRPEAAGGAVLGDFFEKIVVGVEEERKLRGEFIDAEPGVERGLDVGDAVCEGEGYFLDGSGAGFADVIAGDGDGVPLGKIVAAPRENVRDDAHGGAHGIDVGAASDVFLQDVVLNGAGKFLQAGTLALGNGYVQTDGNCGRSVKGPGGGDIVERGA